MSNLPDPRLYGAGDAARAPVQPSLQELQAALHDGRDADIAAALRAAVSHGAYVELWNSVCYAAHRSSGGAAGDTVIARIFALPIVIVTGSRSPAVLSGVLPDVAAIQTLFEAHGTLGHMRNFGLSNALCSCATLEGITPGEVYLWTSAGGGVRRELAPADIVIEQPGEMAHLRFLVGAGITPAAEPSFVETASNIGAWGMPLTGVLAAQLAQPGIEILPLPRPPLDLLRAGHAGRLVQLETAFSLFVSNAVRRFRAGTGDPEAVISAHDDNDLRVSLHSPFDAGTIEGFRWPLHPLDDIARIADFMNGLLVECRVSQLHWADRVQPALNARGHVWFPTARELETAQADAAPY